MGTPAKKPRPSQAGPLKPSHFRILGLARASPVLTYDGFDMELVPLPSLPVKGAVAFTLIRSLQKRGLLDKAGALTSAGWDACATAAGFGEC